MGLHKRIESMILSILQIQLQKEFPIQDYDNCSSSRAVASSLAFPPLGLASIFSHFRHFTSVVALAKIICSFSQSRHLTFRNLDFGCWISGLGSQKLQYLAHRLVQVNRYILEIRDSNEWFLSHFDSK